MRSLTLSVDGMRCRRCVRQATALIRDVDGVRAVTADIEAGVVTVLGTMTDADVVASLRGTSFTTRLLDARAHVES